MKMDTRKLKVILIAIFAFILTACSLSSDISEGNSGDNRYEKVGVPDKTKYLKLSDSIPEKFIYEKIYENQVLALGYDIHNDCISILDKRNGYLWTSAVNARSMGLGVNKTWEQNLASMFNITYTMKNSKGQERTLVASTRKQKPYIHMEKINHGMRLQYFFESKMIGFTVEITMENDAIRLQIPQSGVFDHSDSKLVAIEVLPLFGALPNGTDGYFFVPDGSGALIDLSKNTRPGAAYKWQTYSLEQVELNPDNKLFPQIEAFKSYAEMVSSSRMPVYGIQNGKNAFVCFATSGECDYRINLSTSGFGADINRLCGEFVIRRTYEVKGSDIKTQGNQSEQVLYQKIDNKRIETDRSIQYVFLAEEEADYSGMANAYRNHLVTNGFLNHAWEKFNAVPLSMELFMGIEEKRLMGHNFISMTSFEQAKNIVKTLQDHDVKEALINLKGWNKHGYGANPVKFPADKNLGGDRELYELARYCNLPGFKLMAEANFSDVRKEYNSLAIRNNVVKDGNGFAVTDFHKERYLMNPYKSVSEFDRFNHDAKKVMLQGVSFERLGELIYMDYNSANFAFNHDTKQQWVKMFKLAREKYDTVGIRGGNLYSLQYADILYDIPTRESNFMFTDEDVPFYQMIVHGYIPYVSAPVNLYYDHKTQLLENIEYGGLPHFELTFEEVYRLQNTEYNKLFSSFYTQWASKVVEFYNLYNDELLAVMTSPIIKHQRIGTDLVKIAYENNNIVYINYADHEVEVDNVVIEPMSWKLEKGERSK